MIDPVDIAEPLRSRWSPSIFRRAAQHTLSRVKLTTLLEAARWAPSRGNRQPWAFVVAERGSPSHQVLVAHLSRGNSGWVPRASAVLITAALVDNGDAEKPLDPAYSSYDLGQAAAHVTIQAHAMGLHAHQFSGFDHEGVAAALGVPPTYRVMTGIAVGVRGSPGEADERDRQRELRQRVRKPLPEFVYGARWGQPW